MMKIKNLVYIFLLPLLLSACVDDLGIKHVQDIGACEEDGLAFLVESSSVGTRSVDFNPGAMVKVNSVWVGVFDLDDTEEYDSYKCVSRGSIEQNFLEINSDSKGKDYTNLIRVPLTEPVNKGHKFFMISVVNFNDIMDQNGQPLKDKLEYGINCWKDFVDIAVDTKTGYQYPHDADSPIMAGFLRKFFNADAAAGHVQVNQFGNEEIYPQNLLSTVPEQGQSLPDGILPVTFNTTTGKYDTDGYSFRLRRLVANINVEIEVVNPEIQITNVTYRRHNMPESVYIIERRTAKKEEDGSISVPSNRSPEEARKEAANYADKVFMDYVDGRSSTTGYKTTGYKDDKEWQINSNRDAETGKWSFSFQHFANKHWARNSIEKRKSEVTGDKAQAVLQGMREKRILVEDENSESNEDTKFYFEALASEDGYYAGINDFNNMASYFEVKMHLVDTKNNRCAEAVYVIHEGNTSDYEGKPVTGYNLDDFSTARNISYNYHIQVGGFGNIFLNIENEDVEHYADQGGKVWKMTYLNDPGNNQRHYFQDIDDGSFHFDNILKGTEGYDPTDPQPIGIYDIPIITKDEYNKDKVNYYTKFEGVVSFNAEPNLAFRLYGWTDYRTKYNRDDILDAPGRAGYNYNFERSSFSNLYGLWPQSAGDYSHYFLDYNSLDIHKIPVDLRAGILFLENGNDDTNQAMDIIQFVKYASTQKTEKTYDVYVSNSNLTKKNGYTEEDLVRAFYFADRNGILDEDKCSTEVNIYCIAQYPYFIGHNYDLINAKEYLTGIVPGTKAETYLVDNNLTGGNYGSFNINNGKGMVFSSDPQNIAFRLMGFDDNNDYVDVCYNFDPNTEVYDHYKDLWPRPNTSTKVMNLNNIKNSLSELMNGLKIHTSTGQELTVAQFIEGYSSIQGYPNGFTVSEYKNESEMSQGIRHLYIFDKSFVENDQLKELDQNDYDHQIYGVSQYPYDPRVIVDFKVIPSDHSYVLNQKMLKWSNEDDIKKQVHYTDGGPNWCGTVNSIVECPLRLTESDWIYSYTLEFYKSGETENPVYQEEILFADWLRRKDARGAVTLTLKTDIDHNGKAWEPTNYDFVVTPNPRDNTKEYKGADPVILKSQLTLTKMEWDFTKAPWSEINNEDLDINCTDNKKILANGAYFHDFGGSKYYSDERNFFFEYYGLEMGIYTVKSNTFYSADSKGVKCIPTFYDATELAGQMVSDGPTEGRPYQFKFTTFKSGTLILKATSTKDDTRHLYVRVGKNGTDQLVNINAPANIEDPINYDYNPPNNNNINQEIYINADPVNGTEVLIYAPITSGSINGTSRIFGFELK